MQTTKLTTILFTFPEDQELHYAKVEQEETHDTRRIRG